MIYSPKQSPFNVFGSNKATLFCKYELKLKLTLWPVGIFRFRLVMTFSVWFSCLSETFSNTMFPCWGQEIGTGLPASQATSWITITMIFPPFTYRTRVFRRFPDEFRCLCNIESSRPRQNTSPDQQTASPPNSDKSESKACSLWPGRLATTERFVA